ncbi:MAG: flagellar hook-basal body complex protein [Desulfovibrio sp.]|nr:flagellar hook-basal body complex protein [Desulfovibrio sp.]
MNSALYIGASGMVGLSQGMNVITNNVANVSTIAFKKQDIQYSDLIYTTQAHMGDWWLSQGDSRVAVGQLGHGLQVETVRTIHEQGGMQSSNTVWDMAINGKGFFQVSGNKAELFYTRAGDFRPDNEGVLRMPEGYALNGYKYNDDGTKGALGEVKIDKFATLPAKATSKVNLRLNLGLEYDKASDAANPYFSLLDLYDATGSPPIPDTASGWVQPITLYGANGEAKNATIYFDKAPGTPPDSRVEYVITEEVPREDPTADPPVPAPATGAGLLMSGTLTFSGSGQLKDMSAFTPSVAGSKLLTDWVPSAMVGGLPQMMLGDGTAMTVNFGITAAGGWKNAPANAAAVGTDPTLLPSMGANAVTALDATTANGTTPALLLSEQDGYAEGLLNNIAINADGTVVGHFSNNQSKALWQIPICRFTSEYNLRRGGNNLFIATPEAGQMEMGVAGSENYGEVMAYNIELSNVDMAAEMVNMIITQRGFQSNSKVVTTADQMLQKAMELKRS